MTFAGSPFTTAILAALEDDGLNVGDGEQPTGAGWQAEPDASVFHPYVVVHSMVGGLLDGPIGEPDEDGSLTYQVSSYGATRAQCEWAADQARRVMLTGPLLVPDARVLRVRVDMLGGARRDDEVQPPIWVSAERYRLTTTPDATATGS